jgi:hypothetical protein
MAFDSSVNRDIFVFHDSCTINLFEFALLAVVTRSTMTADAVAVNLSSFKPN